MPDRDDFLVEVYKESGNQVNSNNSMLVGYLGFYAVAIAAFIGLLAPDAPGLNRGLWFFPMGLSLFGFALTVSLQRYVHAALGRRKEIEAALVPDPGDQARFSVGLDREGKSAWWINHRQDVLFGLLFFIGTAISVWFTMYGDPFGLADGCLNFPFSCVIHEGA